ncbi:MAG: RluA family pseudouridine synthase [Rhodospirillales bacterium]|jgi:23S rRNA pseudouridine955/2504/2580 synthase|nr:RluA family pseudouridine synthase [Rhodospirillales bacterium]
MSEVRMVTVTNEEDGLRLDRWLRRHCPEVPHGRLQKWLRTGQVRIGGRRAKAGARLAADEVVRLPPMGNEAKAKPRPSPARVDPADAEALRERVLYRDAHVLVLNKPAGLAVQGGSGTHRHLDAMLDALTFDAKERPRLVHRLDKDTSGVLVLARSATAAAHLAAAFRGGETRKLYWAATVGVPKPARGRIDQPLGKVAGQRGERVTPLAEGGRRASTLYRVVERAGKKAAWLALEPLTGRTHQLRVHCTGLGTPILGDGKYGGQDAFLAGGDFARALHLHARALRIASPGGGMIDVQAPLPSHMRDTWRFLGFEEHDEDDPFAEFPD